MKNYGGGVRKIAKDLIEQDLTHQNLFEITSAAFDFFVTIVLPLIVKTF